MSYEISYNYPFINRVVDCLIGKHRRPGNRDCRCNSNFVPQNIFR